jgi:protein-disulfide isomerase-like protein with CxxC motif
VSDYSRTSGDRAKYRQMFADAYRDYDSMYDAVDAVVAAVREDERARAENLRKTQHTASYRMGREEAAEDIRAAGRRLTWSLAETSEYYARIAEHGPES